MFYKVVLEAVLKHQTVVVSNISHKRLALQLLMEYGEKNDWTESYMEYIIPGFILLPHNQATGVHQVYIANLSKTQLETFLRKNPETKIINGFYKD
jgi:hypothetical protein